MYISDGILAILFGMSISSVFFTNSNNVEIALLGIITGKLLLYIYKIIKK